MARLNALKNWLEGLGCYECRMVMMKIGHTSYPAVEYKQDRLCPTHMPNPGHYTVHAYYVLGPLPTAYKRGRVDYILEGKQWYIAGYWPTNGFGDIKGQPEEVEPNVFHPFGHYFILHPSNGEDDFVTVEQVPANYRMPIRVQEVMAEHSS